MKHTPKEDLIARWAAAACTLAILFFLGSVLLHTPMAVAPARDEALQVYFVPRAPDLPVPPPRTAAAPAPAATPARAPARSPAVAAAPTPLPTPRSERPTAAAREHEPMAAQLYTREGRVRLPPGAQVDALDSGLAAAPPGLSNPREIDRARRIMERPNPVNYRETRFAKDWKSDGTLGDVAVQGLNRGMKNVNRAIFGDDVQTAKARPPPDVRFNPGLAENAGDLGREATGDAYKGAPIAHEAPPDLKGEASRRIRSELAALEPLLARCDSTRRAALLTPARTHLGDLERAEHALGHGADPVMAEQMLPRQADSAYDLARRALWYARQQAATCKG